MTSPPENVEVTCPECGTGYETWYRPSINVDLDPEIAADADYMHEATTGTCPECGHEASLPVLLASTEQRQVEIPRAEHYPPFVTNEAERKRWDASLAIARQIFGADGEDHVWMAARSIYKSDIPTDG